MAGREVRKTVTVLFCDLVHSTGLAEGDPEAYRRVQSRFFEAMRETVERHGGTVEKFIGDEVMAVFGVPRAHEDDALRAVRAAEDMQEAMASLGLEGRIGINTGEVIAGDPEQGGSFVAGEPVIIAKRLEQAAETGEILIGKATYPLVKHALSAGPLERIPVKGKREEIGPRRVDEIDREAPGVARRLHAPLVGRKEELELLSQAFERAVEERSCRLFTILGPAGIGKSRLAGELCSRVADQATTASGRCVSYGEGITFWPVAEVVRSLGGEEGVREVLADSPDCERVLELVREVTGSAEPSAPAQDTFWAVRRSLEAVAQARPLVVCLEDLHWAEPTLLDLVEYLVGWSRDAPILVIVLARPELVEQRPSWISTQPNSDALILEPLSEAQTSALFGGLGSEVSIPDDLKARIVNAAGGNPLFVEQMAAMAAEGNGHGELSVPPSIQALLAERLDRLTRDEREVIERAAVVGRDFPLSAVSALCPKEEKPTLTRHLLALVRKGLIRPDSSQSADEDRFGFHHVLVRDITYESMPKELRADLHERLADWMEETRVQRRIDELIGFHLEQAHRFRTEIGPSDEHVQELARRAGRALTVAGRRAEAREDVPAALNLLDRAIVLFPREDPVRAELLAEVASLMMNSGRFDEAEPLLNEASLLAQARSDRRLELRIEIERAYIGVFTSPEGVTEKILEIGSSAVAELEELGDDVGLAKAWWLLSEPHATACRWAARAEAVERGLEHARRAGDRRLESTLVGVLLQALLYGPTPVPEASRRCEQFLSESRANRSVQAGVLSTLAVLRAMAGEIDEGRRLWGQAAAIYEELGLRHRRAIRSLIAAEIELLAGDPEAAIREIEHGDAAFAEMGDRGARATLTAYLADALYAAGRLDEALEVSGVSEELSASDDIVTQVLWRCARAKVLAERGELERADAFVSEAERLAEPTDFPDLHARIALSSARLLTLSGRDAEARAALERAHAIYAQKGNIVAASQVAALLSNPVR